MNTYNQDNVSELAKGSDNDNIELIELIIIDDAADLRGILHRLIERSGLIRVIAEANSTEEAFDLIKVHDPDVILLDLSMPGGGALDLIKRLRNERERLAIVVLSGYPASTTAVECIERGADRYLEKGQPISTLISEILKAYKTRNRLP